MGYRNRHRKDSSPDRTLIDKTSEVYPVDRQQDAGISQRHGHQERSGTPRQERAAKKYSNARHERDTLDNQGFSSISGSIAYSRPDAVKHKSSHEAVVRGRERIEDEHLHDDCAAGWRTGGQPYVGNQKMGSRKERTKGRLFRAEDIQEVRKNDAGDQSKSKSRLERQNYDDNHHKGTSESFYLNSKSISNHNQGVYNGQERWPGDDKQDANAGHRQPNVHRGRSVNQRGDQSKGHWNSKNFDNETKRNQSEKHGNPAYQCRGGYQNRVSSTRDYDHGSKYHSKNSFRGSNHGESRGGYRYTNRHSREPRHGDQNDGKENWHMRKDRQATNSPIQKHARDYSNQKAKYAPLGISESKLMFSKWEQKMPHSSGAKRDASNTIEIN